jgi:hypothetical protein
MRLFTTVLFIEGNPVGYEVQKDQQGFRLNPAENPNREVEAPVLFVNKQEGFIKVEGTLDRNLIDQVIEDLTINPDLPPSLRIV